jgi:hypothetical protein
MFGANFKQQVSSTMQPQCRDGVAASGPTSLRVFACPAPESSTVSIQQVRNLARYTRGGYNPDSRVDVIISVMVRLRHPCFTFQYCPVTQPQRRVTKGET